MIYGPENLTNMPIIPKSMTELSDLVYTKLMPESFCKLEAIAALKREMLLSIEERLIEAELEPTSEREKR